MISQRKAELFLVLTTFVAATGWIFSKQAMLGLPAFGFIGLRFMLASLCLLPFCYRALINAQPKDIAKLMCIGMLLGGGMLSWSYAVSVSSTLGEGAFIVSLSMLLVPLVAWGLFKQRPKNIFWVALPFAVLGLFLLSIRGNWQASSSQIWFAFASFLFAFQFNFNGKYSQRIPLLLLVCVQLFTAGAMGLAVSMMLETVPNSIDASIWVWLALSTLLATVLRFLLQMTGQKYCPPASASIIMLLEAVWVVLLSVLFYNEAMPLNKIVGGGLILTSLLIFRLGEPLLNKALRLFSRY